MYLQVMIYDTTYQNKEAKELINDCLGAPYSLLQSLKMGGVGSKRMMIEDVSHNMRNVINRTADINYGNIELRPNGILVMINKGLKNFTWAIPFRQLVVYKTDGLSIHAQGKYIRFKGNKLYRENAKFLNKMLRLKSESSQQFEMPAYE